MKYKLVERGNPGNAEAAKKWYANPVKQGTKTLDTISKDISGRSSLTSGDVSNVIENLIEQLPKYLVEGNSVKLGNLGTFRISFSSEGVEKPADFTTDKIRGVKILFTPSSIVKKELETMKFEQMSS
ncbi:hypothetical protein UJ101_01432 [Flavobacteriaceae bacterium UJ101]|nr:hypothetical protein UJ101_01432 [Flavobacteriaceae bacterium UJ101]